MSPNRFIRRKFGMMVTSSGTISAETRNNSTSDAPAKRILANAYPASEAMRSVRSVTVSEMFGNWLRAAADFPPEAEATVLVAVHLKA
jgi:hypothetical protein